MRSVDQKMTTFLKLLREQGFKKNEEGLATFSRMEMIRLFNEAFEGGDDINEVFDLLNFNKLMDAESKVNGTFEGHFITNLGVEYLRYPENFVVLDGEVTRHDVIKVDTTSWTGLTAVRINARNARIVSSLIDTALGHLNKSEQGNEAIMQASAYLKAAQQLVDAPDPPSAVIWDMIQKAATIVSLAQVFYTIFQAALLNAQTR